MFKFKQIYAPSTLFPLFFIIAGFFSESAFALGQKPSGNALDYVQNLNEIQKTTPDFQPPKPVTKILAKCGEQKNTSTATGVLVTDTGEIYGYKGTDIIEIYRPSILLAKNKKRVDQVIEYAKTINLHEIQFKNVPDEATYCGVEYYADFKTTWTKWAKHPYLREINPPPKELLILFEAINNVALDKPPFIEEATGTDPLFEKN